MTIEVFPHVPKAMGLGGSAALAVSVIRALNQHFDLGLDDHSVNGLAYECEVAAHGTPSGVDNTLATYGTPLLFRKGMDGAESTFETVRFAEPLPPRRRHHRQREPDGQHGGAGEPGLAAGAGSLRQDVQRDR